MEINSELYIILFGKPQSLPEHQQASGPKSVMKGRLVCGLLNSRNVWLWQVG